MVSHVSDDEINLKYINQDFTRFITQFHRKKFLAFCREIQQGNYQFITTNTPPWTVEQKSRLIESIIINIPISHIICYEIGFGKYKVIDGNKRVEAINDFYYNQFQLVGLEAYPELDGRTYDTLPDQIQSGLNQRSIITVEILLDEKTPPLEDVIEMLRERYDSSTEEEAPDWEHNYGDDVTCQESKEDDD